ncbi:MAG: menaquinone biosynthesis protein [Phycisphaerales bacterium]|nr:menaquinone biosynthesis protein [Planctomycetota bacterium]MBL6998011.1 menaquinone biosynthesis protein [Phycisphaerales bacterium]
MTAVMTKNIRIGVVNFLNAAPMVDGISDVDGIQVIEKVPSDLIGSLERNEVDVALASSIDYQQTSMELGILPVGVLSSDGESLTVQLCSRVPLNNITKVHCDSDSHTSVALLQIMLQELYAIHPEVVSTDIRSMNTCDSLWPETVLIIGDKVVTSECESEFEYTLDLGQAWKQQTGLPFVFAAWFCQMDLSETLVQKISMLLQRQLAFNTQKIEQIVSKHATGRGWDAPLAIQYLTKHMQYEFIDAHVDSLQLFYSLAKSCGILKEVRQLHLFGI